MRKDFSKTEMDEVIRTAVKMEDVPAKELNHKLKAKLYQRERVLQKQAAAHQVSLWYLPMILNFILFSLCAVFFLLVIENTYLSYFAAGLCLYVGIAGIVLTITGIKRTNIKEDMSICIEKRGVLV